MSTGSSTGVTPGPMGDTAATRRRDERRGGRLGPRQFGVGSISGESSSSGGTCRRDAPGERLLVLLDEPIPPELLDHDFMAVALAVLVVAVFLEHDEQRFAHAEQLGRGVNS